MSGKPQYLNVGCGVRFHPDWINLDIEPQGPGVVKCDLNKGIPLENSSCDVVYNAAVLEHLRRPDADNFIREGFRVLKPGGVLRIGVPDLERIARLYLEKLEGATPGNAGAADDYDWIMLEMFDQTLREQAGGGMIDYLRQNPIRNEDFVFERIGDEGRQLVTDLRALPVESPYQRPSFLNRLRRRLHLLPSAGKQALLARLLGEDGMRALAVGQFRLAGEVHQWMYDRFSLARLLASAGFDEIRLHTAATSDIPDWHIYHLDILPDGQVMKPDLFFMEALKPREASIG